MMANLLLIPCTDMPPRSKQSLVESLPLTGFVRQAQLVGRPDSSGPLLPFSAATLWRMVRSRSFPAPVKLAPRITAWRVEDVQRWMNSRGERNEAMYGAGQKEDGRA